MALRGFVKGRADNLGLFDRALHVGNFFRALVDQQYDEVNIRIIGIDGIGQRLQQHGFTGAGRGNNQAALPTANGRHDVEHAVGKIFFAIFHDKLAVRIDGREVVKKNKVFGVFRRFKADFGDLEQGKVAFALLGGADLTGNYIALAQGKPPDLRGRHVDVIRAGHVAAQRRPQKAKAIGQNFKNAITVNGAVL